MYFLLATLTGTFEADHRLQRRLKLTSSCRAVLHSLPSLTQALTVSHPPSPPSRLASIEALSSHPLAAAVVSYARLQGVEASTDTADFEILPGEGVTGLVQGRRVHVGNARTAERLGWNGGKQFRKRRL